MPPTTASGEKKVPFTPADHAQEKIAQGDYDTALQFCAQALAQDPSDHSVQFAQGFALFLLERLPEAQAVLDRLIRAAPTYPDAAWLCAGCLRQRHGDRGEGVLEAYDKAIAIDPSNLYAQAERADVLRAWGRYEEAREIFGHLANPDICDEEGLRLEAEFKRGCVSLVLQDMQSARTAFRAVLEAAPDYPDAQEMYELTL